MKTTACLILGALLYLSGCGGSSAEGPCAGSHVGDWSLAGGVLTFDASCAISYRGPDGCENSGSYSNVTGSSGTAVVNITQSDGGACLGTGQYSCPYEFPTPTTLNYSCSPARR